jgi:hypothetical protein
MPSDRLGKTAEVGRGENRLVRAVAVLVGKGAYVEFIDNRVFIPERIGSAGWYFHSLILLDDGTCALSQIAHHLKGGYDSFRERGGNGRRGGRAAAANADDASIVPQSP